jgi:O-antigen biosynthesis protein WbqP
LGRRSTSATSCGSSRDDGPKRLFDVLAAVGLGVLLSPLMLGLAILVRTTSKGPAIYWSKRIGKNNLVFNMPKFRTMRPETPAVATHLLDDPDRWVTPVGRFLRKLSLDELPQLYSIVKGDMSFVGPRPALFNQDDLVALRTRKGVHRLVPGVTGWAQVNGRDELPVPIKVDYDEYYLQHQSLSLEVKILGLTIIRVARRSGVSH